MPSRLRVAIAGAGLMGRAHAAAFRACGARVVAVADPDPARAAALAAECGATACASVAEALAGRPDALSICLPHHLHYEAAALGAAHGAPLLIEKPHCVTLAESRALRALVARHGVPAMAGFTHRFLATSRRLHAALRAGRLGAVPLITDRLYAQALGPGAPAWYADHARAGGGIALIGMIHSLDRLRWLLGRDIVSVQALVPPVPEGDVEGTALALVEFAGGTRAALVAHRSPAPGHARFHECELLGERMHARCVLGSFDHQELHLTGAGPEEHLTVTGDNPFVAEVLEFTSALVAGRPPAPDLLEAELALAAILALYESARAGQPVRLAEFLAPATAG